MNVLELYANCELEPGQFVTMIVVDSFDGVHPDTLSSASIEDDAGRKWQIRAVRRVRLKGAVAFSSEDDLPAVGTALKVVSA